MVRDCDLFKKSWKEIAAACKQKNKKILSKHMSRLTYDESVAFLRRLFDRCMRYDDGSCIESLLPFAVRFSPASFVKHYTMDHVVDYYHLMFNSMIRNKMCFEYLVGIAKNINRHITNIHYNNVSKPLLHRACEINDHIAVGMLLKHGADVNVKEHKTGRNALYYALESFNMFHDSKRSNCIVQMLLLAGINTNIENIEAGDEDPDEFNRAMDAVQRNIAGNCY